MYILPHTNYLYEKSQRRRHSFTYTQTEGRARVHQEHQGHPQEQITGDRQRTFRFHNTYTIFAYLRLFLFFYPPPPPPPTGIPHRHQQWLFIFYPLLFIRFYKVYIENRHKTSTFHSSVNNRDFSKRHRDSSKNSREMDFLPLLLVLSSSLAHPLTHTSHSASLSLFQQRLFLSFLKGVATRGRRNAVFFWIGIHTIGIYNIRHSVHNILIVSVRECVYNTTNHQGEGGCSAHGTWQSGTNTHM